MDTDRRKARSDLANAAKLAAKNPDDPTAVARVDELRTEYRTLALAEAIGGAVGGRTLDDPVALQRAARIIRGALARNRITLAELDEAC